ncbi:MAG: L-seryl-tRNA(Sec) selenium transferase [Anaerolineaceae bacterium]|nr:L-seryl-tRNA(Sec) selenium transferase [Anaerolineaceae bacterium]
MQEALRNLPSIDRLLQLDLCQQWCQQYGRPAVTDALRSALNDARGRIHQRKAVEHNSVVFNLAHFLQDMERRLDFAFAPSLRTVINATGVILHTNLGRAPLSGAAIQAMQSIAKGYSNLEYDLEEGKRGRRDSHAVLKLKAVTGAEDALIVNNNAAALVLLLSALARGREVIISRGQLVEIGGGFRIPEIMAESGALLREVGSTNRTRLADYREAIHERTAMLLRVHPSNFRQSGFVKSTPLSELVALAREHEIHIADDLGSGSLLDTTQFGLPYEPTVQESVACGADVVLFSGDKLLGGPQAGILVGRKTVIQAMREHPLARAMRADKLALAALDATLNAYQRGFAAAEIPIWRMIARNSAELQELALRWQRIVGGAVIATRSTIGGGSIPGGTLPSHALALTVPNPNATLQLLRQTNPPVIARIEDDAVVLDPRTVLPEQEEELLKNLQEAGLNSL